MQYMLPWRERVMGSSSDYEAAQDRARALWDPLTWPDSLVVVNAVSRLDGYGGFAIIDTEGARIAHLDSYLRGVHLRGCARDGLP